MANASAAIRSCSAIAALLLLLLLLLVASRRCCVVELLHTAAAAALLGVCASPVGGKLGCVALAGAVSWQHHLHKLCIVDQPVAILVSLQQRQQQQESNLRNERG